MYCKLFASLYQGTLRGRAHPILVFTNLLAHADSTGIVDKHFRAIAEEVGITMDEVNQAILALEAPDPESRSPEMEGARIVKLDDHRAWGWQIVNYGKYRAIKNEDDRREQNRLAQERWRAKHRKQGAKVSSVSTDKPPSAQAEAEAEAEDTKTVELELEVETGKKNGTWNPTPFQLRLGALFRRRKTTAWSEKELKLLKGVKEPDEDDWRKLEAYYFSKTWPPDHDYRMRDLETLLNNFSKALDRARSWKEPSRL